MYLICTPVLSTEKTDLPPGYLRIVDAESDKPIPEVAVLPVVVCSRGYWREGLPAILRYSIDRLVMFHPGDPFTLREDSNYGVILYIPRVLMPACVGSSRGLEGFIVLAPGYRPKHFWSAEHYGVGETAGGMTQWSLSAVNKSEAANDIDVIRAAVASRPGSSGDGFFPFLPSWEVDAYLPASFGPQNWAIELRLTKEEKQALEQFLTQEKVEQLGGNQISSAEPVV